MAEETQPLRLGGDQRLGVEAHCSPMRLAQEPGASEVPCSGDIFCNCWVLPLLEASCGVDGQLAGKQAIRRHKKVDAQHVEACGEGQGKAGGLAHQPGKLLGPGQCRLAVGVCKHRAVGIESDEDVAGFVARPDGADTLAGNVDLQVGGQMGATQRDDLLCQQTTSNRPVGPFLAAPVSGRPDQVAGGASDIIGRVRLNASF